jgi:hypothetical protein
MTMNVLIAAGAAPAIFVTVAPPAPAWNVVVILGLSKDNLGCTKG